MPRASWSVQKIHYILLEGRYSGCSQTKSKQACPGDRLGRENREKKGSSMAGLSKVKVGVWGTQDWASKVMCSRYMPPLLLKREGIYKLKCSGEHFFDAFPASIVHFLFPSVPKIPFGDPWVSRETDAIHVLRQEWLAQDWACDLSQSNLSASGLWLGMLGQSHLSFQMSITKELCQPS